MNIVAVSVKKGSKVTEIPFRVDTGNNQLMVVFDGPDVVLADGETLNIEFEYEGGCQHIGFLPHIREVAQ